MMSETPTFSHEAQIALHSLQEILRHMGFPATVTVTETPDQVLLNMESDEPMGLLIGKGGQTLNAIELLVRTIAQQQLHQLDKHIVIDAEGYRERQTERLQTLAQEAARKVVETNEPFAMEPMNARDRRTVHMALLEIEGAESVSVGEGPYRHIVVCRPGQQQEIEERARS